MPGRAVGRHPEVFPVSMRIRPELSSVVLLNLFPQQLVASAGAGVTVVQAPETHFSTDVGHTASWDGTESRLPPAAPNARPAGT